MAGLEIEDLSVAPGPGGAAAEQLASPIAVGKQQVVRLGDIEGLAIDLLLLQLKGLGDPLCNGVSAVHGVHPGEVHLAPFQIAAGAQQVAEGLAEMSRVQGNKAHAPLYPFHHPKGQLIRHRVVGHMPPPNKHVRFIQQLVRQTELRVVQSGVRDVHILVFTQMIGQRAKQPIGIRRLHAGGRFFQKLAEMS